MRVPFVVLISVVLLSCSARHPAGSFRVIPAKPNYLLRAPDSRETPFPEVLEAFTRFTPGWVDLRPQMELRVENAYYREGSPRRGLADYLGTAVAHFGVGPGGGLRLLTVQSGLTEYPHDQPPLGQWIEASMRRYRYHQFSYEVLFNRRAELRGAVLLGAASVDELDRLAEKLLADPGSVCPSLHCTVFPETCTVSLEMEIAVNGVARAVLWGSVLSNVAARPRHLELWRPYAGRSTPVEIDPSDPAALRFPLLPGDRINWD